MALTKEQGKKELGDFVGDDVAITHSEPEDKRGIEEIIEEIKELIEKIEQTITKEPL